MLWEAEVEAEAVELTDGWPLLEDMLADEDWVAVTVVMVLTVVDGRVAVVVVMMPPEVEDIGTGVPVVRELEPLAE